MSKSCRPIDAQKGKYVDVGRGCLIAGIKRLQTDQLWGVRDDSMTPHVAACGTAAKLNHAGRLTDACRDDYLPSAVSYKASRRRAGTYRSLPRIPYRRSGTKPCQHYQDPEQERALYRSKSYILLLLCSTRDWDLTLSGSTKSRKRKGQANLCIALKGCAVSLHSVWKARSWGCFASQTSFEVSYVLELMRR